MTFQCLSQVTLYSFIKGVLIDFITPSVFVDLKQPYWLEFTVIDYLESSDEILPIFIVKITLLIKANQR